MTKKSRLQILRTVELKYFTVKKLIKAKKIAEARSFVDANNMRYGVCLMLRIEEFNITNLIYALNFQQSEFEKEVNIFTYLLYSSSWVAPRIDRGVDVTDIDIWLNPRLRFIKIIRKRIKDNTWNKPLSEFIHQHKIEVEGL